jgi:hypothetical protein
MTTPEVPPAHLLNPDGTLKQITVSQRRSQIDETRFIDIRGLAYLQYKKPDKTPLMRYEETLDNRDIVKAAVLNFETNAGWLIRDGTEGQVPVQVVQPPTAAPQGVPQMSVPFSPPQQNGAPQPQFAPPQNGFQQPPQPQFAPQGQPAPQQPQYQAPQMQPPPVASPQQAAAPQQQEAPTTAPTGRRRKGAAVAPPPGAPPPQPQAPAQPQMQFAAPPQQQVPVQQFQQPQVPQGFQAPVPQAPQPQAPAHQQPVSVDLTPVFQRIDAIGGIVSALGKELGDVKQALADSKMRELQMLTVLQHLYLSHPQLGPSVADKRTLPEFQAYLSQFVGTPQ